MSCAEEMDVESDKVIDRWVCEFFLRRQLNPRVSGKKLLSTMRLEDDSDCASLRKSAVLRDIWIRLIDGTVDERTLDHLELMEKLLLQESCVILESLKSAYCWVAVECTVKYMLAMEATKGVYLDALERIWARRIGSLKERRSDLVTRQLIEWEDDLKNAIEDPDLYQRIRETNTRYNAFSYLGEFVREHWALMGSSSLEFEAQRRFQGKSKDTNAEGDNGNERGNPEGVQIGKDGRRPGDVDDTDDIRNEQHGIHNGEEELEQIANERSNKVAEELRECLFGMLELINNPTLLASKSGKGETSRNAADRSTDGASQPVQVDGADTGGQDHNEGLAENLNDRASESEGASSGRVKPHLPTPTQVNVSPLRRGRLPQHGNTGRRRQRKHWTPEEVDALREGVKNYGKAWKDIKDANPAVFADRTEVDLKDKWRNLVGR